MTGLAILWRTSASGRKPALANGCYRPIADVGEILEKFEPFGPNQSIGSLNALIQF